MSDIGGDPACWSHLFDDDLRASSAPAVVVDLGEVTVRGSGAVWSLPNGGDLDANLVRLEPDAGIGEHVNDEVDVLVFVQSGTAHLHLGETHVDLASDHLVLIRKARGARSLLDRPGSPTSASTDAAVRSTSPTHPSSIRPLADSHAGAALSQSCRRPRFSQCVLVQ